MAQPNSGYQPRNTPPERRAFFEQKRYVDDGLDAVFTDPDTFTGTVAVTIADSTDPDFISNRTGSGNVDGAIHTSIRSAGTEIGRITRATSTTAGFLTTSDEDLKENFAPVDDELASLWMRMIEPYFFNYIGYPDVIHVGYRAQEAAELWPNGVTNGVISPGHGDVHDRCWDDDGNEITPLELWQAWMMDHSKPGPILHACLRTIDRTVEERGAILDDHADRITVLEDKIAAQAAQITDLEDAVIVQAARITDLTEALADVAHAADIALAELRVEIFYTRQMTAYWQYSNTATSPPGAGQIRTNTAQTEMYIHSVDTDGYNRVATLDAIMTFTATNPQACRFRVRGATGSVFELRSNGRATKTGLWYTVPITVISGTAADKGFRIELTMLSEIWAEDPPPFPTLLPA